MNQKKGRGSERGVEQRGGNIMDKGSNEAERERGGERKEGRTRESDVEVRKGRGAHCRVESGRGGGRGREARECVSLPAFLTLRLCLYASHGHRERA